MSSHIPNLGAINQNTYQYCCAKLANKKEKYICPECNKYLIIKKGTKRIHHFAHYKDNNQCTYYNNPTETQIHKDAKLTLKLILETGMKLKIIRKCSSCISNIYEWDVPSLKNYNIETEYRFDYNNSLKIADLAVLYKNNIYAIFEIYNSHKTINDARPEPWFEFDAKNVLDCINIEKIELECIRKEECDDCLRKRYIKELQTWLKMYGEEWNGDQNVLENLVRKVLGQTEFNKQRCIGCEETCRSSCSKCDQHHMRFNFDAQQDFQNNKDIIDIFNSILPKYVVINSHKGTIEAYIINKEDEKQYNYYNEYYDNYKKYPYKCRIHFYGNGTVYIIISILKVICHHLLSYNKMTKIELNYDSENPKILNYKSTSASFSKEKIYLQILFSEKDIVKRLGARWDVDNKKWYVSDTAFNREKFLKWIK